MDLKEAIASRGGSVRFHSLGVACLSMNGMTILNQGNKNNFFLLFVVFEYFLCFHNTFTEQTNRQTTVPATMLRCLLIALLVSITSGFNAQIRVKMSRDIGNPLRLEESSQEPEMDPYWHDSKHDPCWQDIYDADCNMDSIFSARFIASEWIRELPCGSGMHDCDFPTDALMPEMRPEAHHAVDVMDYLNIKRVHEDDGSKLSP
jgi:hypothetical protein